MNMGGIAERLRRAHLQRGLDRIYYELFKETITTFKNIYPFFNMIYHLEDGGQKDMRKEKDEIGRR